MIILTKGENKIHVMYLQDGKFYEVKKIKDVYGNPELGEVWPIQVVDAIQVPALPIYVDIKLNKTGKTIYTRTIYVDVVNHSFFNFNSILGGLKKVMTAITNVCGQISMITGRRIDVYNQDVFEVYIECPIDISVPLKECITLLEKDKGNAARSFWDMF